MESKSEIILYQSTNGNIKIDVTLQDETVWLTIDQMCELFQKSRSTVNEHIINIFEEQELDKEPSMRKIGISDFSTKPTNYYNLDVIISVGYRVKSQQGTQFRIWATQRLKEYIIKGFALNDERFKTGNSMNYFNELQERIREIRLSERFFYQKIKDIYATSIDYNPSSEETLKFFKVVQNKLLWAISKQTAAELVARRASAELPLMGMQSLDKTPKDKINKADVSIAKNYLNENEMKALGLLVEQYLAFAEAQAQQQKPMYMKDWIKKLNDILVVNEREILEHAGSISHKLAVEIAEKEFEKYQKQNLKNEKEESLKELESDLFKLSKFKKRK
jgi:hypothetical protein